jgi:WD40 repeat protein
MMNLAMMNPAMMNPAMMNLAMMNPAMMNLAMMNLAMMNPAMMNPAMMNLAVYSLAMMNPAMMNPAMMNLAMMNPAMMNLAMMNPAMMNASLTDLTWEVRNEGNTTATYSVNMVMEDPPEGFIYELLVYRLYTTPVADGCDLTEEAQHQMLVHIIDPDLLSGALLDPSTGDGDIADATFPVDPMDEEGGNAVYVTLRVIDPDAEDDEVFDPTKLSVATVAQAVNTEDAALGLTQQPYAVPDASIPMPFTMTTGRVEHAITVLADGRVLVTGGFNSGGVENSAEIFDWATGQFEATGAMFEARAYHTSTLLDDGRVLVVGAPADDVGWSAEIFNPETGTFATTTGDLIQPREGHTATKLADGRVLITGGNHIGGLTLNSAEIYDPTSDSFSLLLNTMSQARLEHTATLMNNGRVLITGGIGNTAEVFNPTVGGGTFTAAIGLMSDSRRYHSAALLPDGKVLIAGGFSDLGPQVSLVSADIYDPATNALTPAADMVDGHAAHIAELLPNGKVLIAGGSESPGGVVEFTPTVELYDWVSGTFSYVGALAEARTQHAATRLPSGNVLITGGSTPGPPIVMGTDTFELYHPGLPSKMALGESLGTERVYHTATLLRNGTVLVAGGGKRGNHPSGTVSVESVELFDPSTNTFSSVSALPVARFYHSATRLTDGKVLLAGGVENLAGGGGAGILNTAVMYDPFSDTYSLPITMTSNRFQHEATLLFDGRVLITGGRNASNAPVSSAEIYDPYTNTFHDVSGGMSVERFMHEATLLSDGRVLVTGGAPNLPGTHQTAEIWDPTIGGSLGGFDSPITMVSARQNHSAILMPNGRVLLSGGMFDVYPYIQDSLEIFDPSNGSFTASSVRLTAARRSHTSTLLPNGKVLLVGGSKLAALPGSGHVFGVVDIYDPATDTMSVGDPLWVPRSLHSATDLHDGRVLITGGWEIYDGLTNLRPTKSVEIYDPFGDVQGFFSTGDMSTARYAAEAMILSTGEVLVAGGAQVSTPFPNLLTAAELFDPISGTFSATGDLNLPRYNQAQARLHDGRVLVAGGLENGVPGPGEIYDPSTGVFTATSGSTNASLASTATLLPNGRVLIAGNGPLCTAGAPNTELFEPSTESFSPTAGDPITRRAGHTATMLGTGEVLIAGGFSCASKLASAELYDPLTDSFSPSGDVMNTPRIWHTATLLPSGKVLIVGGQEYSFGGTLASGEIYDPLTDSFTLVGDVMEVARENHTATVLANGKVLIAGGIDDDGDPWPSAEVYDPWTDSFSPAGEMDSNRVNHFAVPLSNGKVFIGGGWDGFSEVATAELYVAGLQ